MCLLCSLRKNYKNVVINVVINRISNQSHKCVYYMLHELMYLVNSSYIVQESLTPSPLPYKRVMIFSPIMKENGNSHRLPSSFLSCLPLPPSSPFSPSSTQSDCIHSTGHSRHSILVNWNIWCALVRGACSPHPHPTSHPDFLFNGGRGEEGGASSGPLFCT